MPNYRERGVVSREKHRVRALVPWQDLTGAARTWAERYEVVNVLRHSRASKETGIGAGEYARVVDVNGKQNWLTVELADGRQESYDPRRQSGVSVCREEEREFSQGDRIQFTAPANDPAKHPHLDHGYAVTSHSSQGQTAERVLVRVETELGAKDLLRPMWQSRAGRTMRSCLQMIAREAADHTWAWGRSRATHAPEVAKSEAPEIAPKHEHSYGFGIGMCKERSPLVQA